MMIVADLLVSKTTISGLWAFSRYRERDPIFLVRLLIRRSHSSLGIALRNVRRLRVGSTDISRCTPQDYSRGTQCSYVLNPAHVPL